jgi:hypothetical protein
MLVELAAINAAYSVIREVVGNGQELYDCGAQLSAFFDNKAALQRKVNAAPPDRQGHLEEFFALEKIKQQEEELRQLMQWTGRAGLWDDWLAFQAQAARARREEAARIEREAYERREMLKRWVEISALVVFAAGVIVGLIWVVLMIAQFAN